MVALLTPDEWPFATDEERAAGWEHLRAPKLPPADPRLIGTEYRAAKEPLTDRERINVLLVVDIVQMIAVVIMYLLLLAVLMTK